MHYKVVVVNQCCFPFGEGGKKKESNCNNMGLKVKYWYVYLANIYLVPAVNQA